MSPTSVAHLAAGVGEDDRLGDGQRLVQVAQGVQLPVLALLRHEDKPNQFVMELARETAKGRNAMCVRLPVLALLRRMSRVVW